MRYSGASPARAAGIDEARVASVFPTAHETRPVSSAARRLVRVIAFMMGRPKSRGGASAKSRYPVIGPPTNPCGAAPHLPIPLRTHAAVKRTQVFGQEDSMKSRNGYRAALAAALCLLALSSTPISATSADDPPMIKPYPEAKLIKQSVRGLESYWIPTGSLFGDGQ